MNDDARLLPKDDLDTFDDEEEKSDLLDNESTESVNVRDGESISGESSDPESDDSVLDNEHDVGLAVNANDDQVQDLNIAQDVEDAENAHRHG